MARRWFKGNLHTHTTNSDGDAPPGEVVAWYRDAGYDFLALTDHDLLTLPDDHRAVAGPMALIHGEEVTAGDIHMNALGIRRAVAPVYAPTERLTLEANAGNIRVAGGVPSINHPNYRWALRPTDIEPLSEVSLFEVYNAAPDTNGGGKPGHPRIEGLWDVLLSLGKRMIGIAVDDAHHYHTWGHRYSNPGRAWVHVLAESTAEADILPALEAGDCYASTGVRLESIDDGVRGMAIDVEAVDDHLPHHVHRPRRRDPRRRGRSRAALPLPRLRELRARPRRRLGRAPRLAAGSLPGLKPHPPATAVANPLRCELAVGGGAIGADVWLMNGGAVARRMRESRPVSRHPDRDGMPRTLSSTRPGGEPMMSRSTPWLSLGIALALSLLGPMAAVAQTADASPSPVAASPSPAVPSESIPIPQLGGLAWYRSIDESGPQIEASRPAAEVTEWSKLVDGAGATFGDLHYTYQQVFDPSNLPDIGSLATVRVAGAETDVLQQLVVADIGNQVIGLGDEAPSTREATVGGKDVTVVSLPAEMSAWDAIVYATGDIGYVFLMPQDLAALALAQLP